LRSFTFVQDIIDGIVSVIGKESQVDSQIINIGTEEEHTTQQGIDAIEKITGKKNKD
jgi:UDP-glucuronate 4-epimerase